MLPLKGFTLVELLVVITIVGVTLGMVGPFSEQQIARAKAMEEWIQFQSSMQTSAHDAFILGQHLQLSLDGRGYTLSQGQVQKTKVYNHIFFPRQIVVFNQHGLSERVSIDAVVNKKQRTFTLEQPGKLIEVR